MLAEPPATTGGSPSIRWEWWSWFQPMLDSAVGCLTRSETIVCATALTGRGAPRFSALLPPGQPPTASLVPEAQELASSLQCSIASQFIAEAVEGQGRTAKAERSRAHMHGSGESRRVYLRGHENIRKRLLIPPAGTGAASEKRSEPRFRRPQLGILSDRSARTLLPCIGVHQVPIKRLKTYAWREVRRRSKDASQMSSASARSSIWAQYPSDCQVLTSAQVQPIQRAVNER